MFALTVTRALTRSSMPSFAIAEMGGVSMTLGLTDTLTALSTSRPARSIALAVSGSSLMLALCALINALTTLIASPLARTCVSSSSIVTLSPAFDALMYASTMVATLTPRHFIPMSLAIGTLTPDTSARNHILTGSTPKITAMRARTTTHAMMIPVISPALMASNVNILTPPFRSV